MSRMRSVAALLLALVIVTPPVSAQSPADAREQVGRETEWIEAEIGETALPPIVEAVSDDLPGGVPSWVNALVGVIEHVDPGWFDDGQINGEDVRPIVEFVDRLTDEPAEAIGDAITEGESTYFDVIHDTGEATEDGLDTGESTYYLIDREAAEAQSRTYGLAWEAGGAAWQQIREAVGPGAARVEDTWSVVREGDQLAEPDQHGVGGLGDVWEEATCQAHNLGTIQPGADDECNLYQELQDRADCVDQASTDFDCDGLDLVEEFCWGTDPLDPDTDDDAWEDGPEAEHWDDGDDECTAEHPEDATTDDGVRYRDEEAARDTDGDGTPNILDIDSDDDHLRDGDEHGRDYPASRDGSQSTGPAENKYNDIHGHDPTDPAAVDTDGDGLTDYEELCDRKNRFNDHDCSQPEGPIEGWGTDPNDPDTDGDGASDRRESIYWTEDRQWYNDYDQDGISNNLRDADADGDSWRETDNSDDGVEMTEEPRTEAGDWDTDGDGMPDGFEHRYDLDPVVPDASDDGDGDGLTNFEEYTGFDAPATSQDQRPDDYDEATQGPWTKGLDPSDPDVDDDGLTDGSEVRGTLNTWKSSQYYHGYPGSTDAKDRNTDDDTLDDEVEIAHGTDPNEAYADADGDGVSDDQELQGWTVHVDGEVLTTSATSDPHSIYTDDDRLDDGEEFRGRLHARREDTDDDGLDDGAESDHGCRPHASDTDGDGLEDPETAHGTYCSVADSDADGLSDGFEVSGWKIHIDGATRTVTADPTRQHSDPDSLDDGQEHALRTDPLKGDSDADGLDDDKEAQVHGTDPTQYDTDDDGRPDGQEVAGATDPNRRDSDGDGVSDSEESHRGTDPSETDSDDDRLGDYAELHAFGTDPTTNDTDLDGRSDAYDPMPEVENRPPQILEVSATDTADADSQNYQQALTVVAADQNYFRVPETSIEFTGMDRLGQECDASEAMKTSRRIRRTGNHLNVVKEINIVVMVSGSERCPYSGFKFNISDEKGNGREITVSLDEAGCIRESKVEHWYSIPKWAGKHAMQKPMTPGQAAAAGIVYDFAWTAGTEGFETALGQTPELVAKHGVLASLKLARDVGASQLGAELSVFSKLTGGVVLGVLATGSQTQSSYGGASAVTCSDSEVGSVQLDPMDNEYGERVIDPQDRVVTLHTPGFHDVKPGAGPDGETLRRGLGWKRAQEQTPGITQEQILWTVENDIPHDEDGFLVYEGPSLDVLVEEDGGAYFVVTARRN